MVMPPPMPDRQYTKKMSTGNRVLIGCGIGCGTIIILVLIAIGIGAWWFFSSEEQTPTDRILSPGSSAAFRLDDISKNQEAMELISDLFKETQRIDQEQSSVQLPETMIKLQKYFEGQQDPAQFIKMFSPKEATLSISTDEAGNPVFIAAANFGTGTRMVKMFLNTAFENDENLKDKKISTDNGDLFLFENEKDWNSEREQHNIIGFYKGTLLFSNNKEYALSSLENLAREEHTGELNNELSESYYRLSQKGSLAYGVLDGALLYGKNIHRSPFEEGLGAGMKRTEISLDNLSGESGILNLRIDWHTKDFAAKAKEQIDNKKVEWIKKAEQNGFALEVLDSLEDERLSIQFRINNLKDSLIYQMRKSREMEK